MIVVKNKEIIGNTRNTPFVSFGFEISSSLWKENFLELFSSTYFKLTLFILKFLLVLFQELWIWIKYS